MDFPASQNRNRRSPLAGGIDEGRAPRLDAIRDRLARRRLQILFVAPAALVVLGFAALGGWLLVSAQSPRLAVYLALAVLTVGAVVAIGLRLHAMTAHWLARMTVAADRLAASPGAEDQPVSGLPVADADEIGRLARALERATDQVHGVMDSANEQNAMLFAAKHVLEERLTERLREIGEARIDARRTAEALAKVAGERAAAEARARKFETLIEHSGDAIVVIDGDGRIEYTNYAFERLTGYAAEEALGRTLDLLRLDASGRRTLDDALATVRSGGVFRGVLAAEGRGGRSFYADATISPVAAPGEPASGTVAILRDATERVRKEAEIHYLAKFDSLTRLPNRVSLLEHLQALTRATRRERDRTMKAAVLYIDLDGFKPVNDRYGHHVGDRVLAEIAGRFRSQLRSVDMVARVGGDEFVAVLADTADLESSVRVARKLIDALEAPVVIGGKPIHVTASAGVSLYPDHGTDAFYLIKLADAAMYLAKEQGGARVAVYSPAIEADAARLPGDAHPDAARKRTPRLVRRRGGGDETPKDAG